MKFVALALAILLAAGCQARSLQADAPSQYEHARAAVVTYLTQVKETAQRAINHLGDTEYKEYKDRLTLTLDGIQKYLESTSETLGPVRTVYGPQFFEILGGIKEKIANDVEQMRKDIEPKKLELKQVVQKHLDEYKEKLEPLIKEYSEKSNKQMEELRAKMDPVLKELREKIKVNVEETKSKLTPIVDIIRNKLHERIEELKATFGAHIQEYKEKYQSNIEDLRKKYDSGDLQKKLSALTEELKPQLSRIFETIHKSISE